MCKMIRLLYITICALAFVINANANHLQPQIKVTRVQIWYVNQKYVSLLDYKPTKHNETYNNIELKLTISKDLPADTALFSKVYTTNSKHENAKLLLVDNTPICKESPHRLLLPKVSVLPKSLLHGKCLKAGVYNTEDAGNFRFDVLVPNINEISNYHYTHFIGGNDKEVLFEATFYSESGYLKKGL